MEKYQCDKCLLILTSKFDYEPKCLECDTLMRKIIHNGATESEEIHPDYCQCKKCEPTESEEKIDDVINLIKEE